MNQPVENAKKTSISILELFIVFIKHKKKIFLVGAVFCIISIILYFFVFDLIYMSTASIKGSTKSSGLLGSLDVGISDLGGLDDFGLGGGKSAKELAAYEEILNSRRCIEELIVKFDLMNRDEYRFMEDAVKSFKENQLGLKQERMAGVLYVSVLDKDPILAKEMVDFLIMQLDKINIELNIQNAKNNREFIENRYIQAKTDLAKVEDSLKAFQLIYGIAPDLQIKASAQSVFTLESELKSEEVKLEVISKMLSADQPEVKLQAEKVNSLRNKIQEIYRSTDLNDFIRLGNSPQIAMSYLRLQRDLEIQNKILTFLLPVYEQSKIEEKRETPTIIVLDKANVPEKKTKPKRLTMVLFFTFLGLALSYTFFFVMEKTNLSELKNYKKNSIKE